MTEPTVPGEAISRAASRLTEQRQAARALSEEIAEQRQREAQGRETPPRAGDQQ